MRTLMWFRTDLRTSDNTALSRARTLGDEGVGALFVISPAEWRAHDVAPVRVDFWLRSLRELAPALKALRIPLLIRTSRTPGDVPKLVLACAQELRCGAIFANREYEVNEASRDAALEKLAAGARIQTHLCHDQALIEPGSLRTGEGRPYTVFTPFKKSACKLLAAATPEVLKTPKPCAHAIDLTQISDGTDSHTNPQHIPGFESAVPAQTWPAGESAAQRALKEFAKHRIENYKQHRDAPALPATSQLSPHLAAGTISIRQCLRAALSANDGANDPFLAGREGVACWISELMWRDFYIHIMHAFPRVCKHRAFQPATERIRWKHSDAHLAAWQQGRTGVPIVDAGMRQLRAQGWMHNRVRMITAMYLTKNLFLDWRLGEQWFMRNLVDGFLASNNGGWQWSASTGTDAAPYFRVFNPASQSAAHDARGEYIRAWVPELRGLSDDAIHEPWTLAPLARARLEYPEPLVDLSTSRAHAIETFKKLGK